MYSCWVDHGDCQGCLHAVFIIGRSVCQLGDQFVSRCLAMLPLLQMEFASPPPHFIPAWDDWGKTYSAQQFPMFDDVPQFLCLKLMCLASMVNHCWFIVECFNANHIVLASGQLFRDEEVLHQLDNNPNCVVVTYPWSSNGGSFMGVPPHVAVLQELHSLKVKQLSLIDNFISKVKTAIEECDLASGSLSEQRL